MKVVIEHFTSRSSRRATRSMPRSLLSQVSMFKLELTMIIIIPKISSLLAASALVGTKVPAVDLDLSFPPTKIDLAERTAGKKVILVGLPGAFTPT